MITVSLETNDRLRLYLGGGRTTSRKFREIAMKVVVTEFRMALRLMGAHVKGVQV